MAPFFYKEEITEVSQAKFILAPYENAHRYCLKYNWQEWKIELWWNKLKMIRSYWTKMKERVKWVNLSHFLCKQFVCREWYVQNLKKI